MKGTTSIKTFISYFEVGRDGCGTDQGLMTFFEKRFCEDVEVSRSIFQIGKTYEVSVDLQGARPKNGT